MHIGLTYDLQTDALDERQAEFDPPATIEALRKALESLGHHVSLMGNAAALLQRGPQGCCDVDLVFNIAEGTHGRCREAWVPMLLELWGIPFVGSQALTQALALDKVMSKQLAQASGVLTPRWCLLEHPDQLVRAKTLGFPLIVKPRYEGSGMGIDPGAVIWDVDSLHRRVEWASERFHQACLVEQFIPFGEVTVFLIGNDPPQALPAIQRPLDPSSRLSCHVVNPHTKDFGVGVKPPAPTTWLCPVELTPALDAAARKTAVTVFDALACRDVARVDFRADEQGTLYFLEINPLPSFDPEGSLGLLAEYLGTTYTQLVGQVLDAALSRLHMTQSKIQSPRFKISLAR